MLAGFNAEHDVVEVEVGGRLELRLRLARVTDNERKLILPHRVKIGFTAFPRLAILSYTRQSKQENFHAMKSLNDPRTVCDSMATIFLARDLNTKKHLLDDTLATVIPIPE